MEGCRAMGHAQKKADLNALNACRAAYRAREKANILHDGALVIWSPTLLLGQLQLLPHGFEIRWEQKDVLVMGLEQLDKCGSRYGSAT
jgi:hypothetical protein